MELCYKRSDKHLESLQLEIRRQTNMGDIVSGIWCRSPDQEYQRLV